LGCVLYIYIIQRVASDVTLLSRDIMAAALKLIMDVCVFMLFGNL